MQARSSQDRARFRSDFQRLAGGHDAQLCAILADQANLFVTDILVNLISRIADIEAPPVNLTRKIQKRG